MTAFSSIFSDKSQSNNRHLTDSASGVSAQSRSSANMSAVAVGDSHTQTLGSISITKL